MAIVLDRTASVTVKAMPRAMPITINGVLISRDAIARETQHHPADDATTAWQAAARALAVRELLLQEARRLDLVPSPAMDEEGRRETDEEALVRQLIEREVSTQSADDDECRRVYDARRVAFRSSDLHVVRHILLAAAPGDGAGRQKADAEARSLIAAISSTPERFSDLAEACSSCPSRAQGGALGQVSRGQTVPEFEAALQRAPVGIVAPEPIETRYGFHVVIVDQRIEGVQLPFELVKGQIAARLGERARDTRIRHYLTTLAWRADITGIDLNGQPPRKA
jgi:peptidyl-prolyl cis-trans isomerase C